MGFFKKLNQNIRELLVFWVIFLFYAPLAIWARGYFLENALLEPHPWRQTQTALTVMQLFQGTGSVWDYRSPLNGILWNNVYEFPVYQWVVSRLMLLGGGLEMTSRLVTLASFLLSAVFAFFLARDFFGKRVANWFLFLYLISPFGVVFSRVCLIDYFALSATLASVYGLHRIRCGQVEWKNWIFFGAGGLIAGLAKINIWFFPTVAAFGVLFYESFKGQILKPKRVLGLLMILLLQVSLIVLWNYHRSVHLHSPADTPWLIGKWYQRFELWRWEKIIWNFSIRSLFFDWLFLPFVLGIFLIFKKSKVWGFLISTVFILHTLVFFQVQTFHDYYLIATMPYLFWLVAMGVDYLCQSPKLHAKLLCAVMVLMAIYKAFSLKVYYSPIVHDYRPELRKVYLMKENTSPKDIVFWDAKQGRFEIATYSERKVGLSETFGKIGQNNPDGQTYLPSVFRFDSESSKIPVEVFNLFPIVWLDGVKEFKLYRTESVDQYVFRPEKHLAVLDHIDPKKKVSKFRQEIDNCEAITSLVVNLPKNAKSVVLESDQWSVVFPGNKKFLSIPYQEDWGCKFKIKVIS